MTLAELLASKKQGTERFPSWSLADLLARRDEPLDAKFNPSGVGPGVSYGSLASILADFTPGIGDVKSGIDAAMEAASGNYGMSLADALGALPLIGGVGAIKAYHGSNRLGDSWFDNKFLGSNTFRYDDSALGHFASTNPKVANDFAGSPLEDVYPVGRYGQDAAGLKGYKNKIPSTPVEGAAVYPVDVRIKNPKVMTAAEYRKIVFDNNAEFDPAAFKQSLIDQGYDGIKIKGDPRSDWGELRATSYIAFDGSQYVPWFSRRNK